MSEASGPKLPKGCADIRALFAVGHDLEQVLQATGLPRPQLHAKIALLRKLDPEFVTLCPRQRLTRAQARERAQAVRALAQKGFSMRQVAAQLDMPMDGLKTVVRYLASIGEPISFGVVPRRIGVRNRTVRVGMPGPLMVKLDAMARDGDGAALLRQLAGLLADEPAIVNNLLDEDA